MTLEEVIMTEIFCCPICKTGLRGWPPSLKCSSCEHTIQTDESILFFTDEPNLNLKGNKRYVGYDPVANSYAQYGHPEELDRQISIGYGKVIAELVGPGRTILNLGCGPGKYDVEIAKRGCRLIAGDISLNMLKILSSKLQDAPAQYIIPCRLNAYNLPLLDQSVDAVVALLLLGFVGDAPQVVSEIRRVLKPAGIFITEGPIDRSPTNDIVNEINGKIRRYYSEVLKEKGANELKSLGWTHRQMWENLPKLFRSHRFVESEDLVFRFIETPGWFLRRLSSRYTSFQIELDQEVHDETMKEVRNRLISEYGKDFENLKREYCETHRLSVYSG
jgi:ubiquinone/menaquinone biosynthesis C-methylase UbiE